MDDLQKLMAIEEIKQLKSRYFVALDTKDMTAYAGVFTEDARIDVRGSVTGTDDQGEADGAAAALSGFDENAIIVGGAAMARFVMQVASELKTVHQGYMPQIEMTSDRTAKGLWAFEDRLWYPEGAEYRFLHGFGHYHETYSKTDGGWHIASMVITRLKVLIE